MLSNSHLNIQKLKLDCVLRSGPNEIDFMWLPYDLLKGTQSAKLKFSTIDNDSENWNCY